MKIFNALNDLFFEKKGFTLQTEEVLKELSDYCSSIVKDTTFLFLTEKIEKKEKNFNKEFKISFFAKSKIMKIQMLIFSMSFDEFDEDITFCTTEQTYKIKANTKEKLKKELNNLLKKEEVKRTLKALPTKK